LLISAVSGKVIYDNFAFQNLERKETRLELIFNKFSSLIETDSMCYSTTAYSISFKCQRFVSCIDGRFFDIFIRILKRMSHLDLVPPMDPLGICLHNHTDQGAIKCGNRRNMAVRQSDLWECKCPILDRINQSDKRLAFEDYVIERVTSIINVHKLSTFNLAIFGSGGLLGEQILLMRLIHELRVNNYSGTIKIFLIDQIYKNSINNSANFLGPMTPISVESALGGDKCFYQFLSEMSFILPPNITLEGEIFSEADDYISRAHANDHLKYDFLIGADPEGGEAVMAKIKDAIKEKHPNNSAVLTKIKDDAWVAGICQVGPVNLEKCYPISKVTRPSDKKPESKEQIDSKEGCICS
ncbi:MAG: hypothetical protein ACHQUC_02590, partial [Chlamydiales bacterium]